MSPASKKLLILTADRKLDRRIQHQAASLEAAGWDVIVLAMPKEDNELDLKNTLRIAAFDRKLKKERAVVNIYSWVRRLVPMNSQLMRSLKKITWTYLVDPEAFYQKLFMPTARRFQVDVILAADLPMLPVAAEVAVQSKAKLIYDSHELYCEQEFSAQEKKKWQVIEKKYIGACDAVITINESIASELKKRYSLPKVHVILNADKVASHKPERKDLIRSQLSLGKNQRIVLFQGGFSADRNLENLVLAMQHVANDIVLVMLGDGVLKKRLKRLADKHCPGRVIFIPAVPQDELLDYTASADLGLIPYQANCLNNYLCTPNKLFEFIAAGLPILASDLPELRRFVKEKEIGEVADLSRPEAIAKEINKCFSDSNRLDQWRRASEVVRKEINWETEGKKFLSICESVL